MRATITSGPAPASTPITIIKSEIEKNIGKKIKIMEINRNSKKVVSEFTGTIKASYNNLFIITQKTNKLEQAKSFNYSGFSVGLLEYEIID